MLEPDYYRPMSLLNGHTPDLRSVSIRSIYSVEDVLARLQARIKGCWVIRLIRY
jgi:hypothetical protein